jgi:meiotic recombination protein SPO11
MASPKGLLCGSGVCISLYSGHQITLTSTEALLVPSGEDIAKIKIDKSFGWVLVVEKEVRLGLRTGP